MRPRGDVIVNLFTLPGKGATSKEAMRQVSASLASIFLDIDVYNEEGDWDIYDDSAYGGLLILAKQGHIKAIVSAPSFGTWLEFRMSEHEPRRWVRGRDKERMWGWYPDDSKPLEPRMQREVDEDSIVRDGAPGRPSDGSPHGRP